MDNTFTKKSAIGIVMLFLATSLLAQIPIDSPIPVTVLSIDSNSTEIIYPYTTMVDYGVNLTQTVSGQLEWARDDGNPGCDPTGGGMYYDSLACNWGTVMDLTGKMAVIRRGACFFSQKIYNAQAAGAVGVIICNNDIDDPDSCTPMSGADSMEAIVIPAVLISYNSCENFADQIALGETIIGEFRVTGFNNQTGPYAYGTPVDQIIPLDNIQVSLLNGDDTNAAVNTTVTCEITDPTGTVTTLTTVQDIINPHESVTIAFDDYLPSEVGTYTMDYSNTLNADELEITFKITEGTWQLDNENIVDWIATSEDFFVQDDFRYDFGNYYKTGPSEGIATHATFQLENWSELYTGDPDADVFEIRLYDTDPDGDGIGPTGTETDYSNWEVVGLADYIMTGNETAYEQATVSFSDPVVLKADGQYVLMVQYDGTNADIGIPPHYAFGGTQTYPSYHSMVYTNQLYTSGWAANFHGVIRLHTDNFVRTTDIKPLAANKINVFPNPTNSYVNLELNLDTNAREVRVGIMDVMGKLISTQTLTNVQNEVTQIDVSKLTSGTYFLSVVTPEGFRSVKFTIAK